jgi:hypothetical protein
MFRFAALTFGFCTLLAAAAPAQTRTATIAGAVVAPPLVEQAVPSGNAVPRPLFSLGNLPVGVWAPVAPPYDATANRNGAANPFWAVAAW